MFHRKAFDLICLYLLKQIVAKIVVQEVRLYFGSSDPMSLHGNMYVHLTPELLPSIPGLETNRPCPVTNRVNCVSM